MSLKLLCVAALAVQVLAHDAHDQEPLAGPYKSLWYNSMDKIPGDGGTQVRCLQSTSNYFKLINL